jgi:hypothetical protein
VKSPRELLLRGRLAPDRAGADTQVVAQIPLSQLRQLPAARELADAWRLPFNIQRHQPFWGGTRLRGDLRWGRAE